MDLRKFLKKKRDKKGSFKEKIPFKDKVELTVCNERLEHVTVVPYSMLRGLVIRSVMYGEELSHMYVIDKKSHKLKEVDIDPTDLVTVVLPASFNLETVQFHYTDDGKDIKGEYSKFIPVEVRDVVGRHGEQYKAYDIFFGDFILSIVYDVYMSCIDVGDEYYVGLGPVIEGEYPEDEDMPEGIMDYWLYQKDLNILDNKKFPLTDKDGHVKYIDLSL